MSSYSKGAQGLSVFLRVHGIFTATSISPSLWPRQRGDRYAIRAGRNLPDKEFRYLRTVIVTAAVYRGFESGLRLRRRLPGLRIGASLALTPPLNLPAPGRRQSVYVVCKTSHRPMFLVNSRHHHFSAAPRGWTCKTSSPRRAPLIPKVRGYFAEFLGQSSLERLGLFIPST